jgi:CxxC-x17-CxxC domain-containing protein
MHKTTCSDCGRSCEVPFKPTSNKPVFCSNCFEEQGGGRGRDDRRGGGRGRDDRRGGGRGRDDRRGGGRDFKQSFRATCDSCQQSCEVPFKPSNGKPIYCDSCFGKDNKKQAPAKQDFEVERKLKELTKKVDLILEALNIELPKKEIFTIDLPEQAEMKNTSKKTEEEKETKKTKATKEKKKVATKSVSSSTEKTTKKAATKKSPAKKTPAKKTTTKAAAKKTVKKAAPKKTAAKKTTAKKTTKKATTKKAVTKKKTK